MKKRLYISNDEAGFFDNNKMLCLDNPPTQGDFIVGDIVISNRQQNGIFGWVCVLAGSPGRWEVICDLKIIQEAIENLEQRQDSIVNVELVGIKKQIELMAQQAVTLDKEHKDELKSLDDKISVNADNILNINTEINDIANEINNMKESTGDLQDDIDEAVINISSQLNEHMELLDIVTENKSEKNNQIFVSEMIGVARSYYKARIDNESNNTFIYNATSTPLDSGYNSEGDKKNAIDCSTFVGLVLRGIPFKKSPYASLLEDSGVLDENDKDTGDENGNNDEHDDIYDGALWDPLNLKANPEYSWSINPMDWELKKNMNKEDLYPVRTASQLAQWAFERGWAVPLDPLFTNLEPGDLIFWAKKKNGEYLQPNRYKQISHVAICVSKYNRPENDVNFPEKYPWKHTTYEVSTTAPYVLNRTIEKCSPEDIVMICRPDLGSLSAGDYVGNLNTKEDIDNLSDVLRPGFYYTTSAITKGLPEGITDGKYMALKVERSMTRLGKVYSLVQTLINTKNPDIIYVRTQYCYSHEPDNVSWTDWLAFKPNVEYEKVINEILSKLENEIEIINDSIKLLDEKITNNSGGTSTGIATLHQLQNVVVLDNDADSIEIGISLFDKEHDILTVHKNSVHLIENVDYEINEAGDKIVNINNIEWAWLAGDEFVFEVLKNDFLMENSLPGSVLINQTLTKEKLDISVQDSINEIENIKKGLASALVSKGINADIGMTWEELFELLVNNLGSSSGGVDPIEIIINEITIKVGETYDATKLYNLQEGYTVQYTYTSIIAIEDDHTIVGKEVGTTNLEIICGEIIKNVTVNVVEDDESEEIPCTNITLNDTTIYFTEKDVTKTLVATLYPANTTDSVTWESSNTDIATVDNNGVVTSKANGECTITATCGDIIATCDVVVSIACSELTFDIDSLTVGVGAGTYNVAQYINVIPISCQLPVTWSIDKTSVATIDSNTGVLTPISVGTATITAQCGDKSATCPVNVYAPEVPCTGVSFSQDSITISSSETYDLNNLLTITPDGCTDEIEWSTDSNAVVATDGIVTVLNENAEQATVTARCGDYSDTIIVYVKVMYNITYNLDANVSLDHQTDQAEKGSTMTWVISYADGYTLDTAKCYVLMDGVDISSNVFHYDDGAENPVSISIDNIIANVSIVLASKSTDVISCTGIDIADTEMKVIQYESESHFYPLNYAVTPTDTTDRVVWTIEQIDPSVVIEGEGITISSDTLIIPALSKSKVTDMLIMATCGSYTDSCRVIVDRNCRSIQLDNTSKTIDEGGSFTLVATVSPSDCPDNITWSSSDSSIASVSSSGKVTGNSAGTCVITATCGGIIATCDVTVNPITITAKQEYISINTNMGDYQLDMKEYFTFTNVNVDNVTWTIENTSGDIGTLNSSGILEIAFQTVATAKVTATYNDFSASTIVQAVRAAIVCTGLTLNNSSLNFTGTEVTQTLVATPTPANTTDSVTWESSNTDIATVDNNGVVTSKANGECTITATCGDKSADCIVTVLSDEVTCTGITLKASPSDTISVGEEVYIYVTISPSNCTEDYTMSKSGSAIGENGYVGLYIGTSVGTSTVTVRCGSMIESITIYVTD